MLPLHLGEVSGSDSEQLSESQLLDDDEGRFKNMTEAEREMKIYQRLEEKERLRRR